MPRKKIINHPAFDRFEETWPSGRPAPDYAGFDVWLEKELGIEDPNTRESLWISILGSSQSLLSDESGRPDSRTLRNRLKKIERQADALLASLSADPGIQTKANSSGTVEDWTASLIESAEFKFLHEREDGRVFVPRITGKEVELPDGSKMVLVSPILDIQAHLNLLKLLVHRANEDLGDYGKGRRSDETLRSLVHEWTHILTIFTDIEVAVDYHTDGEPITKYARFMHEAIKLVDPNREPKLRHVLKLHLAELKMV